MWMRSLAKINACVVQFISISALIEVQEINFNVSNMIQPLTFEPNAGHEMDLLINTGKASFYLTV